MKKKRYTIKQILLSNQNWWRFYEKHKANIRPGIVICVVKLLSCKNIIRGYQIITLFRKTHYQKELILPKNIQQQLTPLFTFNQFLDILYKKIGSYTALNHPPIINTMSITWADISNGLLLLNQNSNTTMEMK